MAERPQFGDKPPVRQQPDALRRFQQERKQAQDAAAQSEEADTQWQQQRFLKGDRSIYLPEIPIVNTTQALRRSGKAAHTPPLLPLHDAIAPYVDLVALRDLAAAGEDIRRSFRLNGGELPEDLAALFDTIKVLLRPPETYQIKSPSDLAAYLMLDMGFLDQEQLKVACLDTKNHLQKVHLVYQGSLNSSLVRVGEVFREPIKLNSAAIVVVHNHPSSDPTPSPEDVFVTQQIVTAGILLDVDVLDHLVIGQGKWVSMRERKLGFTEV